MRVRAMALWVAAFTFVASASSVTAPVLAQAACAMGCCTGVCGGCC
jgi:hypothetical protein